MIVKLLTERHLEFLSLKGGCRGSSESTLLEISCHGSIMTIRECCAGRLKDWQRVFFSLCIS